MTYCFQEDEKMIMKGLCYGICLCLERFHLYRFWGNNLAHYEQPLVNLHCLPKLFTISETFEKIYNKSASF